jgi:hypothetical protein
MDEPAAPAHTSDEKIDRIIRDWEGMPIFFDGKNPVKNSLFSEH